LIIASPSDKKKGPKLEASTVPTQKIVRISFLLTFPYHQSTTTFTVFYVVQTVGTKYSASFIFIIFWRDEVPSLSFPPSQESTVADLERAAAQKEAEWRADLESKESRLRSMEEDNAKLTEALGKVHAAEEVSFLFSCLKLPTALRVILFSIR
jgi:hypothetical protein